MLFFPNLCRDIVLLKSAFVISLLERQPGGAINLAGCDIMVCHDDSRGRPMVKDAYTNLSALSSRIKSRPPRQASATVEPATATCLGRYSGGSHNIFSSLYASHPSGTKL